MLPSPYRLPANQRVSPSTFRKTSLFSLKYARNGESVSRFAFVTRKKIDKRAVVRNRVRRLFRSCVENHLAEITPGYDMLFFLEKGIIDKPQQELCQILHAFLSQEKLLLSKSS